MYIYIHINVINTYIYIRSPNRMHPPQGPRTAPGKAAALARCGLGGPTRRPHGRRQAPRRASVAAVAHCSLTGQPAGRSVGRLGGRSVGRAGGRSGGRYGRAVGRDGRVNGHPAQEGIIARGDCKGYNVSYICLANISFHILSRHVIYYLFNIICEIAVAFGG